MARKLIIAGNFKMNKTVSEAVSYARDFVPRVEDVTDIDVVLCPPFPTLKPVGDLLQGSHVGLGAQNIHWEDSGAFTGEVSAGMLKDIPCQYVIIGHSERRAYFGETNESVQKKIESAFRHGLTPIVCVGETLEQREADQTEAVVEDHVLGGLKGLNAEKVTSLVLAYEPVWAIGTGRTATPEMAQEVHGFIRKVLEREFGPQVAQQVRIQYGGSVKPGNVRDLVAQPDIDGGLVGGACLDPAGFAELIQNARG